MNIGNVKISDRWFIASVIIIALLSAMLGVFVGNQAAVQTINDSYVYEVYRDRVELEYYAAKEALVVEVDSFMKAQAPNTALNAIAIVNSCEKYGIEVKFVLAQGLKESHYGTTGVAAKTNSVFNVLAYDGRSAADMLKRGHGYKHPDMSIEPYMDLLIEQYIVDGKTERDLLHKFVNKQGQRYATDKGYEEALLGIYERIGSTTDIDDKYQNFLKYKILASK